MTVRRKFGKELSQTGLRTAAMCANFAEKTRFGDDGIP